MGRESWGEKEEVGVEECEMLTGRYKEMQTKEWRKSVADVK